MKRRRFLLSFVCLMMFALSMLSLAACGGKVNNFKLSFKVDSEVYQTITTTGNENITIPENPTKTGYEFDGWFWDKDVWSKPFTANSLLDAPISSDMSVYAKFNAIKYDITYNLDGGTHDNPLSYTIEDNITLSDAEKTGYSFVGWYKESDFQTEITNIVEGTIGDLELYASFSINQYSITFDSDGGSAVSTISQNYNTVVSKPQEPIKAGCEFLGWFEENSQTEYIFDKIEARNVELKAKWQTQSYNIVYNLDDGTNGNNPTTYTVEDEITLLTASKTGYEFIGWFTDSAYNNEVSTIAIGTTGDIELWAKFEIENYAINYHFDNEKGQMPAPANATSYTIFDEVVLAELTNIKTGYMFNGWFDAETGGNEISKIAVGTTGVKEIYARFSLIDYKIILNNTKNVSANIPTTYTVEDANIALGNISKDGYTFNGWFTQEDGGEQLTQIVTTNAQDIDLYAEWSIIDYTATFKADGNQVGEVLTFNIENMNVIEPSVPEKTGYTGAWEEYTLTLNDIIINAEYDAIVYKITYNVVGEYGIEEVVNNNVTTYTVESEDIVLLNPTTKGFKFIKWTYNSSDISVIEKGSVGDMLINAVWEEELYTITFNSNGGNAISSITKKYGEEISEPLSPTKDEYCFMGWFTEVALINKFEFITMPAEDLTLYAKWEKYSLTISYNENIQGVSSLEEINAEYLDAKCFDNFNNCFEINIQIYGSVVAGNSVSIKMTAENNGYSATKTITNIKVYGEPSLNYNDDVTYFNIADGLTPEWFNASGIDTYEQPTEIELTIEGEYEAGDIVDVIITSIDKAGNRKAGVVSNVKVYGQPIIEYNKEKVNISINDEINAGLFNATAEDSFGNNLEVIVKREYSDKDFIFGNEYSYTTSTAYNYMNFSPLKSGEVKLHFKNHSANKRTYIMVYCNSTSKVVKTNTYYTNNSYSSLSFNVEEGYDYYVRTYAYSNSYVTLFSMYLESGSSFSDVEGYKEGCTDVISLSAQDSFSNSSKILLPVTTYEIPQIFEASRNEFSEEDKDDITPLTMGVVAQDCFGNYLVVSMFIEEGNYSIGEITKILVSATDAAGNNVQKIVEVKIFGMPIVTYKIDGLKSTDDFSNIRELINANARDSFGKELIVTAKVAEGYENVEMVAGSKIKFELTAKDHLGNVATILTEEISIYSVNDITLDYETNVDLIKLNSKGEEFNARAKDTFGEDCDIVIEAAEGFELKAGETIDLYIVAIDKAGNKKYSNLIQGIDVYDIPTINLYKETYAISYKNTEEDICLDLEVLDSFNKSLDFTYEIDGIIEIGNQVNISISAADKAGNIFNYVLTNIKVYGEPSLNYNDDVTYFNIADGLTPEWFNASGIDTYEQPTEIELTIEGEYEAGDIVDVIITSIDKAGNRKAGVVSNVKVYGQPIIEYNKEQIGISLYDDINANLFNAYAIDSFGQRIDLVIEIVSSGSLISGRNVNIKFEATDIYNNKSTIYVTYQVFGNPYLSSASNLDVKKDATITAEDMGIIAKDSYGQLLEVLLSLDDENFEKEIFISTSAGQNIKIYACAFDVLNNQCTKEYIVNIYGTPNIIYSQDGIDENDDVLTYVPEIRVSFDLNGASGNIEDQIITETCGLSYPVNPTRDNHVFRGWFIDKECTQIFDFSQNVYSSITVYAGWEEMSDFAYRNTYIDIISDNNSSKNYYEFGNYGSSSARKVNTYFTAYTDGSYKLYYHSCVMGNWGPGAVDFTVRNLTSGQTLIDGYRLYSDYFSYISISAKAGDVFEVSCFPYNNTATWSYFYLYVTGASQPESGGLGQTYYNGAESILNASATDSFGKELIVTAKVAEGYENVEMVAGSKIKFELTAKDHLGNVATILTEEISIYSVNDITLDYETNVDLIKLNSKGEEFNARAKDTFGEDCDIVIEAAEGFELKAGETIDLYIVAIDKAGNKKYSNLIQGIDVYDIPTLESTLVGNSISASDTEIIKYYKVYDSMGVELPLNEDNFKVIGEHKFNNKLFVKINVEDIAGNVLEKDIELFVYYNNYLFEKNANGYTLLSYKGNDDSINLSEFNVDGFFVTAIDDGAFENRSLLKSVFIPSTVEEIGQKIFFGCSNLEDLTIPFVGRGKNAEEKESLFGYFFGTNYYSNSTKISQYYSDKYVQYYIPNKLVSVNILGGEIKRGAFYGCSNIKNLTIGENVTSIGMYSFYNCLGIEKIVYNAISASDLTNNNYTFYCAGSNKNGISIICGENVEKFPAYLFYPVDDKPEFSPKITVINIGKNVAKIGNKAFYNTKYLEILNFNAINMNDFGSASLPFYTRSGSEGFTLNIGEEVTKIPNNIFYGWNGNSWTQSMVAKIIFEDNSQCLSIGSNAFSGNDKLLSINFGKNASLKSIGIKAFQYCDLLEEVNLPNTLETIGSSAFESCRALKIVSLGENLSSLGDSAFKNCSSINKLFYNTNVLRSLGSSNTIFSCAGNKMELVIGDNVTSLPNYLFYSGGYNNEYPVDNDRRPSIAKIYFSNKIKTINDYVFYSGVTDLEEIYFAGSVDDWCKLNMKYNMFSSGGKLYLNGSLLTNVEISNDITEIRNYAFASLKDIKTVYIGNNVAKIGANAFGGCENITSITFANDSILKSIDSSAFINCKSLKSIAIPNSVENLGANMFAGCALLDTIEIPFIGAYDFTLSSYNKSPRYTLGYLFGSYSTEGFYEVTQSYENYFSSSGLWGSETTKYFLPKSLKHVVVNRGEIPINAFENCVNLTTVTIETGIKGVNKGAFSNSGVTNVYLPNRTEGCWCTDLNMYRPQTVTITEEDLLNSKTAALYMRETYKNYKFVLD